MYKSTFFLTSVRGGGEWSASRPGRFTPKGIVRGTYFTVLFYQLLLIMVVVW
jgi:hypothetical protein